MMLTICPPLVLVFTVTIPASILFTRYMSKRVRPLYRKRSIKLGELNGYIEEITSGLKTIKAYNREDVMINRFDEHNLDAVDAYFETEYYGRVTGPSVNFINNISRAGERIRFSATWQAEFRWEIFHRLCSIPVNFRAYK